MPFEPVPTLAQRARRALLNVPASVDQGTFWLRVTLLLIVAIWGVRLIALDVPSGEIGTSFMHLPLLVFHEAGHVFFSFFGEFLMIFGGSLLQLLLPALIAVAFIWRNDDPFGAAIATWLFGVSLLDLSPYIYDALDPQLVLLGGHTGAEGGHDWIYLLSTVGWLDSAQRLGWFVHKLGAACIVLALVWGAWLLSEQRLRLAR